MTKRFNEVVLVLDKDVVQAVGLHNAVILREIDRQIYKLENMIFPPDMPTGFHRPYTNGLWWATGVTMSFDFMSEELVQQ